MRILNSRNEERMYYVEGNTARKLNLAPQKIDREEQEKIRRQAIRRAKHRKVVQLQYAMLFAIGISFLFVFSVRMLSVQSAIAEQRREIMLLEAEFNQLKNKNDETHKRLDSSVDLTEVYDVAIKELGMVYPKNGQIVSYEASRPDYVKQFKDIPVK